jgi:hypothetical protein
MLCFWLYEISTAFEILRGFSGRDFCAVLACKRPPSLLIFFCGCVSSFRALRSRIQATSQHQPRFVSEVPLLHQIRAAPRAFMPPKHLMSCLQHGLVSASHVSVRLSFPDKQIIEPVCSIAWSQPCTCPSASTALHLSRVI